MQETASMPAGFVHLVTPDLALIDAALAGDVTLERALGCPVAAGWVVFEESLGRVRAAVAAEPSSTRWGTRLFVLDDPRALVGWGGFKGAPHEGVVEIGYAISPAWEGRGLATLAAGEMVRQAFRFRRDRELAGEKVPRGHLGRPGEWLPR